MKVIGMNPHFVHTPSLLPPPPCTVSNFNHGTTLMDIRDNSYKYHAILSELVILKYTLIIISHSGPCASSWAANTEIPQPRHPTLCRWPKHSLSLPLSLSVERENVVPPSCGSGYGWRWCPLVDHATRTIFCSYLLRMYVVMFTAKI